MTHSTLFDLPSGEQDAPIDVGDAVIVLKQDGSIVSMTVGLDQKVIDQVRTKQPDEMTEEELDLALLGQKLFLLSMAAQSEPIMEMLAEIAAAPGVLNQDKLNELRKPQH